MTEPFQLINESFLTISEWQNQQPNLTVGFTTKNGGVSHGNFSSLNLGLHVNDDELSVQQNKKYLANLLSLSTNKWVGCNQVHDNKIMKVEKKHAGAGVMDEETSIQKTDGIYTKEKDILLTLCFADCVPLYFWTENMVGLAHAGWQGTVKLIGPEMINKLVREEEIDPKEVKVAIGPSISSEHYIVDDKVINAVTPLIHKEEKHLVYKEISEGQYSLDLKLLNKLLLLKVGVKVENILVSNFCTSENSDLFFSHRRDKGKSGRMISFIGMK
ncbi:MULTISPECIES: peptidoglycan editing factor PgeF [Bacillus]|uniref:peptidoglycan editing factor PgeF n=1 Tax=Bacillus TaxID=1386 RepID=UPI000BB84454|nr:MULTISPECIES: peptidoglycan editing factor PgeF [Bacillus]